MDSSEGYRAEKRFRTGEVRDVCTVNCSRILNFMSVRWSGGVEREIERREKGNTSNRRTGGKKSVHGRRSADELKFSPSPFENALGPCRPFSEAG